MKLASLGDIHSNFAALEACLSFLEKDAVDGLLLLGDYVTDCPYPKRTMELLHQAEARWPTWWIRGNREEYLLGYTDGIGAWSDSSGTGSLLYTWEHLPQEELDFFRTLPIARIVKPEGCPPITVCHGSPRQVKECLSPGSPAADACLREAETSVVLCAHTHRPFAYEREGRLLLNGGSVGTPVNGQLCAQFLELEPEGDGWRHRLVSVDYDRQRILRAFAESGLDRRAGVWARAVRRQLSTGRNFSFESVTRAGELARADGAEGIPEIYWQRAAAELGI